MKNNALFEHLFALEVSLLKVEVRSDCQLVDQLLHGDFVEFGCSGKVYDKSQILQDFKNSNNDLNIMSRDFKFRSLSESAVLVTYKSAQLSSNHEEAHHSLRSSIWQNTALGWRLIFHQGTAMQG